MSTEVYWLWRQNSAKVPSTLVTSLLRITLSQLRHDERIQGLNPLRACKSPSRKVPERVRTFYCLINRSLRNRLQGKDELRIKNFQKLEELNNYLKKVPTRKRRQKEKVIFLHLSVSNLSSRSEFSQILGDNQPLLSKMQLLSHPHTESSSNTTSCHSRFGFMPRESKGWD